MTEVVTLPTSIVVVYVPLAVPYDTLYPVMSGSGFLSHAAVTVAASTAEAMPANNQAIRRKLIRARDV